MNAVEIAEVVHGAIVRRAAGFGISVAVRDDGRIALLPGDSLMALGDRLTDLRPSTPESRSLRCDAWLAGDGRWTAAGEALADREGVELDAWLTAEARAQGVEVAS